MKTIVATCFESNEERLSAVSEMCQKKGFETKAFTSDFSHMRKAKRTSVPDRFIALATRPYKKNLSIERILSHRHFAKDLFARIEEEKPDLIWLMAPANSLIYEARRYKENHPDTKIIIDIIDMWPESLPYKINKNVFPLNIWRNVRSRNLNCADLLVSECDLYQNILKKEYRGKIETLRWAREGKAVRNDVNASDDVVSLCYLGSINNIIDTERIASVISGIDMPVVLHVIGEGENTGRFLDTLKTVCEVIYHGAIRDEDRKCKIFDLCHAGINIYKEGLYIGLTVKCIDYFQHGLPIINNIKGDTWDLVEKYSAGINVRKDTIIDGRKLIAMKKNNGNVLDLFDENLTKDIFYERCSEIIDEVIK